jgi:hypothetical protein
MKNELKAARARVAALEKQLAAVTERAHALSQAALNVYVDDVCAQYRATHGGRNPDPKLCDIIITFPRRRGGK